MVERVPRDPQKRGKCIVTDAELAELLAPIADYLDDTPPVLPFYTGFAAVQGRRLGVSFLISVDHDGHIEASFSTPETRIKRRRRGYNSKPATPPQCWAFFRAWGINPEDFDGRALPRVRHYIVRRGKSQ
jgi:hypothetical protein